MAKEYNDLCSYAVQKQREEVIGTFSQTSSPVMTNRKGRKGVRSRGRR